MDGEGGIGNWLLMFLRRNEDGRDTLRAPNLADSLDGLIINEIDERVEVGGG